MGKRKAKITITVSSFTFLVIALLIFGVGARKMECLQNVVNASVNVIPMYVQLQASKQQQQQPLQIRPIRFYPDFQFKYFPSFMMVIKSRSRLTRNYIHVSDRPNKHAVLYLCVLVMLQAGDCQPNPGPNDASLAGNTSDSSEPKFPCNICKIACLWGERAVCCDNCDEWYHVECMGMKTECYQVLEQHSSLSWLCCQCGLPNFASSLFTSGSVEISNSFF